MEIRPSNSGASLDAIQPAAQEVPAAVTPNRPAEADLIPTYSNSIIRVNPEAGLAVLEFRDGMDGEVRFQFPAEHVVREYEHAANPVAGAAGSAGAVKAVGGEDAKPTIADSEPKSEPNLTGVPTRLIG